MPSDNTFVNLQQPPSAVTVISEHERYALSRVNGLWQADDLEIDLKREDEHLTIDVRAPRTPLYRIDMRWELQYSLGSTDLRVLGDHWERSYGDLEWRAVSGERIMPWYFLTYDGLATHGYGVLTGAGALCFWRLDSASLTLSLDVRCGGQGVHLGERQLRAATVISVMGSPELTPFQTAVALCRKMRANPRPRLPIFPVYGFNNWYYAYGNSSHAQILEDAARLAELAPAGNPNRPYMVIDDGWELCTLAGPWRYSNRRFPDMPGLAEQIRQLYVLPGIWIRPLATRERVPESWLLRRKPAPDQPYFLDPTVPEVAESIEEDIRRLVGWGYQLIKHDFSTFDLLGRWGLEMGDSITPAGWTFHDQNHTTAEIILHFYRRLRVAAGAALLLGCNTIGHLGAGLFELQRIGDDTSGREWARTRKMGVNTLAFRIAQHGHFFAADADCVGLTRDIPWDYNRQWLDLLARSGTPLFVSMAPDITDPLQTSAVRDAFALAASAQSPAEPVNWLTTPFPDFWKFGDVQVQYRWWD